MVPIIDDYLQTLIISKLRYLKDNPKLIEYLFMTSRPETITQLQSLLATQKIRVVIGYPREQSTIPAYVITLAPEQERPSGLGDNFEDYGDEYWELNEAPDIVAQKHLDAYISSTFMNSTYRIECWSDNGDLTAYMYSILKWCLFASRREMLEMNWINITLSGTDLEPVPDYMPIFVYRRALQITMTYGNTYHDDIEKALPYLLIINEPDKYSIDEQNNIIDMEGKIVIPYHQGVITRVSQFN